MIARIQNDTIEFPLWVKALAWIVGLDLQAAFNLAMTGSNTGWVGK